ncbi:leucine-rich repeat protein [Dysgonomonas sp. HDW5B]|uniref:leucine-rich repeat domain-containing protein n=1 Tax=Dysgonomonas sp. HDW5B TaxID=2714927 RepID=UPI00140927F7|nr:leucine-rich repeat domain-containing protein [Dysgonomonas sp. HDW5B]QIK54267.1 leucine-rich repeat protein [Dysgonomonas sp. HDW5B]
MTKKILTLLFSVIILVIPTYGQLSKNITVNTPGTLESQLGIDKAKVTDLVLTGTINDADFTTIKQMSGLKNLDMKNVNIENGVIPSRAFQSKIMEGKIIFPTSLKSIGSNAFRAGRFGELDFKACQGLEEIGFEAFWNTNLTTNKVLDFSICNKLTRLLNENGFGTFGGFGGHVILPRNLIRIPNLSFARFTGSVDLPPVLEVIAEYAFFSVQSSAKLIFPVSLKSIGSNAFRSSSFGELDFSACQELEEIGSEAFWSTNLKANNILDFSLSKKQIRLLTVNGFGTFGDFSGHVILPRNLVEIPNFSFARFKGSIDLSPVLETIGESAFANSVFTKGIVFPNSLKTIGTRAFYNSTIPSVSFEQMDPSQSGVSCF